MADGPGFWFALAVLELLVSGLISLAIAFTVRYYTDSFFGALAGAGASFSYLVFGPEEYTFTLFSRNISAMFTALSFAILWPGLAAWQRRRKGLLLGLSGLAIGLAVQTMPTTAPVALLFGVLVLAGSTLDGSTKRSTIQAAAIWGASAAVGFASAPIYYLFRGDFGNYWDLNWTYNRIYAKNRAPLRAQLGEAIRVFSDYYSHHPVFLCIITLFAGMTLLSLKREEWVRGLFGGGLLLWWIAEMSSITLGQRFWPHQFVLTFVPTVLMGSILLSTALRLLGKNLRPLAPIFVVVILSCGIGLPGLQIGIDRALAFRGLSRYAEQQFLRLPPDRRAQRALVEAISTPNDHLMVWAHWTGFYDELNRPPATRYNAVSWFIGTVYGGLTDPHNILPGTFSRWRQDVARTPPGLFLVSPGPKDYFVEPPELAGDVKKYVDEHLTVIFAHFNGQLYVARERADAVANLIASPLGRPETLTKKSSPGATEGLIGQGDDLAAVELGLANAPGSCYLLHAELDRGSNPKSIASVSLQPQHSGEPVVRVTIGDRVRTIRLVGHEEEVEADAPMPAGNAPPRHLTVLAAGRSAVVFLDGQVVGMMRSTATRADILFSSIAGTTALKNVTVRSLDRREWAPCGNPG